MIYIYIVPRDQQEIADSSERHTNSLKASLFEGLTRGRDVATCSNSTDTRYLLDVDNNAVNVIQRI